MTTRSRQNDWALLGKLAFVCVCCTGAAGFAVSEYSRHIGWHGERPDLTYVIFTLLLFAIPFMVSFWLGLRGKQSASWAILAYGSWMIIPCVMLLSILWETHGQIAGVWHWYLMATSAILYFLQGGIREGMRDQWGKVGMWWLATSLLVFFLFPFWLFPTMWKE